MTTRKFTAAAFGLRIPTCILGLTLCASTSFAQVSVTNPSNTTPGLLATYPSLAAAITDLNAQTAIAGPVSITLTGNETAPAGGYAITAALAGASGTNTVTIEGSSSTITGSTALVAGALNDAIFKIIGSDYITIQNFTMQEDPANTTTTAASNNMTEWGVALLYASTTDGAQNCTIQNNTISLNRTYQNTFGIYSNSTHSATAPTTSATATTATGGNSGLKVYGNNISNVNNGIVVVGPTAAADHNTGIDIGGGSAPTGNTLTNYGTTGTFSSYANVSGTVYGILVRNSVGYNISYNSITSSSGASGVTVGTLRGIYVPSASNQPVGTFTNTVNNNTIAVTSHVLAGTINGIAVETTTSSATSTTNINNNNFTALNHTIAAATGTVTGISQSGSTTAGPLNHSISNNTFTNLTSSSTGTFTFISNSWARPTNGVGNISNNSIVTAFNRTGASGTVTLYTSNSTSGATITEINTGNNFSNITLAGTSVINGWRSTDGGSPIKTVTGNTFSNWTGGSGAMTGMAVSFSGSANVSGNTVFNLTGSGNVTGMETGSGTQTWSKNKVYDLTGTGAASVVTGIVVTGGTANTLVNNLVGNLFATTASGTDMVRGIGITSTTASTTVSLYYNTVYVNASSSGANFGTSGVFHTASATATTAALNMRNNIIVNTSTPAGTGQTVAYRRSAGTAGTLANYASTSNNNNFYAGTPSATNLIYADGTSTGQSIVDYKTGVFTAGTVAPRDSASFSENPTFLSTVGSSANFLHIDTTVATQIESGGAAIAGVTDDYDGNTRNATTPDIGADEFNGIGIDLSPPSISYTALANTASTGSRTLSANITDASGVPTAGAGLPVLYWKVNAGSYTAATGSYVSGNQYDFTFGSPVSLGDVVSYYIVAQDGAGTPNVGSSPAVGAGGFTANPPAAATPPTTPSVYYVAEITGTKTVGAGGDYADLASAITALNNAVITRPVVFSLTDASYTLAGPLVINANPGSSATNTVTIKPATTATITGSVSAGALIKCNGASYIIIDGSNSGGNDRSLTLSNTSVTTPNVVTFGSVGTTPIVGCALKNCIVINGVNTSSAVVIADAATNGAGYFSDITIHNNSIQKAYIGVFAQGGSVPQGGANLVYTSNDLNTTGANAIRYTGLYMQGVNGATVGGNNIANFDGTSAEDDRGIWLASGTINASVFNNRISSLKYTGTGGYGGHGIAVSTATTGANVVVSNNMIWDLSGDGWNYTSILGDNPFGIYAFGTQTGVKIHFNSINLAGNTLNQTSALSAGIVLGTGTTADVSNNTVVNNLGLLAATGYGSVGIYVQTGAVQLASANNNNYLVTPTGTGVKAVGQIATTASTTLGDWQTASALEVGSLSVDPLYVSATDLHLQSSSPLVGAGVAVAGITLDIDGDSRGTPPEIGADELAPVAPPCPGDTNGDSIVNVTDLLAVIAAWGATGVNAADLNGDLVVNVTDLLLVIAEWGTPC